MINKELLQQTLAVIKANPDHWNQAEWHCGTTHCFAGFAELLHTATPINTHKATLVKNPYFYSPHPSGGYTPNAKFNAIHLLGLQSYDASLLFDCGNTLRDLEAIVGWLLEHDSLENYSR